MTEFANKIKSELVTRKIITNKLEVKKISGEWNIIIYDKIKTNKEIYNKKIKDIFFYPLIQILQLLKSVKYNK